MSRWVLRFEVPLSQRDLHRRYQACPNHAADRIARGARHWRFRRLQWLSAGVLSVGSRTDGHQYGKTGHQWCEYTMHEMIAAVWAQIHGGLELFFFGCLGANWTTAVHQPCLRSGKWWWFNLRFAQQRHAVPVCRISLGGVHLGAQKAGGKLRRFCLWWYTDPFTACRDDGTQYGR